MREREASGTADFLRKELDEVKGRLGDQEARVSAFKRRHIGENPKNMDANLAVLERLTAQLRLNSDNQNRAMERRHALARQTAGSEGIPSAAGVTGSEPADPLGVQLSKLHQELEDLRTRFSDRYPDVIRVKAEIAAREAQMQSAAGRAVEGPAPAAPESVSNPYAFKLRQAMAEAEAEIAALRTEERRLREDFTTYQRRVENTPLREQEFQELSRDYETTGEQYRTLLKRYEEAQLAETLEQRQKGEQFRILEMARPPSAPWAPNRMRLFLMGSAMSAGLAVASVWLSERLDKSCPRRRRSAGPGRRPGGRADSPDRERRRRGAQTLAPRGLGLPDGARGDGHRRGHVCHRERARPAPERRRHVALPGALNDVPRLLRAQREAVQHDP